VVSRLPCGAYKAIQLCSSPLCDPGLSLLLVWVERGRGFVCQLEPRVPAPYYAAPENYRGVGVCEPSHCAEVFCHAGVQRIFRRRLANDIWSILSCSFSSGIQQASAAADSDDININGNNSVHALEHRNRRLKGHPRSSIRHRNAPFGVALVPDALENWRHLSVTVPATIIRSDWRGDGRTLRRRIRDVEARCCLGDHFDRAARQTDVNGQWRTAAFENVVHRRKS